LEKASNKANRRVSYGRTLKKNLPFQKPTNELLFN
jgi:hypothetical protein